MNTTRINEDSLENNNTAEVKKPLHVSEKEQNYADGQSTSKGIKSAFSETVIVNFPETENEQILQKNYPLSSLDELTERQNIITTPKPAIIFSVKERTLNILMAKNDLSNNPPPPPYDGGTTSHSGGWFGQTTVRSERYGGRGGPAGPQDGSRGPPHGRNYGGYQFTFVIEAFDTKQIRNKFVQKVFLILSFQLLVTFGVIGAATLDDRVKEFILANNEYLIMAIGLYVFTLLILFCCDATRYIFPLNFILLFFTTVSLAYMMASVTCRYRTNIVLVTFGVATGVCILVTLAACQSSCDVTDCGMVFCLASFIISIYGIIAVLITIQTGSDVTYLIYSCLITLLFCMYLMYDIQEILGGRRIELSPDEYIIGALTLYIDFMMIFQQLLYIIARMAKAQRDREEEENRNRNRDRERNR